MKNKQPRLMAIVAHPDDESLGMGGILAKYAAEGVATTLLMATRGERGRFGTASESPGMEVVGKTREQELLAAAKVLGIGEVVFLDYVDGDLDKADPVETSAKIGRHIRRLQPQVVVTFGPEGGYGHPDHIAISQFAAAGIVKAADPSFLTEGYPPHAVAKLYFIAWTPAKWQGYQSAFKELAARVDGVKRVATPFPDWAITTRVNARQHWATVWKAIQCHQTQMAIYQNLDKLTPEQHQNFWGEQEYYRVFSLVNGGRMLETDLFEGL